MHNSQSIKRFQQKIGYSFTSITLLEQALTHRSYNGKHNYERLEFLGDALLSSIIAEYLFITYPHDDEGRLTRMRSTLVREGSLLAIAQALDISDMLILSTGEKKSGGHNRASILADVVEAIIGAIWVDCQDRHLLKDIVLGWFEPFLHKVEPDQILKDPKSRLQEWLQGKKLPLPTYTLLSVDGDAPNQIFTVSCQVQGIAVCADPVVDNAGSRRYAEQKVAKLVLEKLSI